MGYFNRKMLRDNESNINKIRTYKYTKLSSTDGVFFDAEKEKSSLELQRRKAEQIDNSSFHGFKDYDILIDRPIQHGESLASISLKYRIPVAELKRVNRFQKEGEFYALNSLKIPVNFNSTLHDILMEEMLNETEVPVSSLKRVSDSRDKNSDSEMASGIVNINEILKEKQTVKEARQFFENIQIKSDNIENDFNIVDLEQSTSLLTNISAAPIEHRVYGCSGSDWDISWWKMLVIGGIILIGIPCIYLLMQAHLQYLFS